MDELVQRYKREYLADGDPASAVRFANAIIRRGDDPPEDYHYWRGYYDALAQNLDEEDTTTP